MQHNGTPTTESTGIALASSNGDEFDRFRQFAQGESAGQSLNLRDWLDLAESWRIMQALRACQGNRSAAARALGIGRRTLYAKMEKLGITPTWRVAEPGAAVFQKA